MKSDMIKTGLDFAISLMEKLNTEAGATAVQLGLVGASLAGLSGMAYQGKWFSTLGAGFKLLSKIPGPLAVIGGLITAGAIAWDAFHTSSKEALEEANSLQNQLSVDYGIGSRYDELISKQQQLNALEEAELAHLESKKKLLEENIRIANQEAFTKWQEESGYLATGAGQFETPEGDFVAATKDVADLNNLLMGITTLQDDIMTGWTGIEELPGEFRDIVNATTETANELQKWKDMGFELSDAQEKYLGLSNQLTEIFANNEDAVLAFGLAYEAAMKTAGFSSEESLETAGAVIDDLVGKMEEGGKLSLDADTKDAEDKVNKLGTDAKAIEGTYQMHFEITQDGSIPTVPSSAVPIDQEATGTTNAPGGLTLVNEEGPELISANGRAYIAGNGRPTVTNLPKGAIVLNAFDTKNALKGKAYPGAMNAYAGGLISNPPKDSRKWEPGMGREALAESHGENARVTLTEEEQRRRMGEYTWRLLHPDEDQKQPTKTQQGPSSGSGGGGGPTGPTEAEIKEQNKLFKEQIDLLKHKLFLMEKEGATDEERIEQIKKIQEEIEKQKQWYYDAGLDENSKYIQDLEKQWWEYADELKDIYKDQSETYELLFSVVSDKAKDEIDALEAQKQAIQDENSELQKQVELEKALDELAKAKQQKKLVFKDGRMQYVQDVDAVSEAQARVDELQRQEEADKRIAEIDEKIKEWQAVQEQWGGLGDKYSEAQDLAKLKEKFGIDFSSGDWLTNLKALQEYADEYNALRVLAGDKEIDFNVGETALPSSSAIPAMAMASGEASLWQAGALKPSEMMANLGKSLASSAQGTTISIQNFAPNLPGVSDGEGFVDYLRKNFLQQTLQFAT